MERSISFLEAGSHTDILPNQNILLKLKPLVSEEVEKQTSMLRQEFNRKLEAIFDELSSNGNLEEKLINLKEEMSHEIYSLKHNYDFREFQNLEEKLSNKMTSGVERLGKLIKKVVDRQGELEEKLIDKRGTSPDRYDPGFPIKTPALASLSESEEKQISFGKTSNIKFQDMDKLNFNMEKSEALLNHCERLASKVVKISKKSERVKRKRTKSASNSKSKSKSKSRTISKGKGKKVNNKSPSKTSKSKSSVSRSKSVSKSKSRSKSKSLSLEPRPKKKIIKSKKSMSKGSKTTPLSELNGRRMVSKSNSRSKSRSKTNSKSISAGRIARLCETPNQYTILSKMEHERKLRTAKIKEMLTKQRQLENQLLSSTKKGKKPKESGKGKSVKTKVFR